MENRKEEEGEDEYIHAIHKENLENENKSYFKDETEEVKK